MHYELLSFISNVFNASITPSLSLLIEIKFALFLNAGYALSIATLYCAFSNKGISFKPSSNAIVCSLLIFNKFCKKRIVFPLSTSLSTASIAS